MPPGLPVFYDLLDAFEATIANGPREGGGELC